MIPVTKPYIKRKDLDSVLSCLVSDNIGPGELGRVLVDTIASYLNLPGGVALREPARALDISLDLLSINKGAKAIISPLSPAYYLDVLDRKGVEVLYADVDPDTCCLAPIAAEALLSQKPDLLIVHSPLGLIPEWDKLSDLGLPIIEDITTSIGGHDGVKRCGSWGSVVIVSSEESDLVTTGGGALVLGKTKQLLSQLKQNIFALPESIYLSDVNAALGIIQMQELESFIAKRKEVASYYTRALTKGKNRTILQKGNSENIYYSFPVMIESNISEARKYAGKKGVETKQAFIDSALASRELENYPCPNAKPFLLRCLLFPLYPALGKQQIENVARVLSTLP